MATRHPDTQFDAARWLSGSSREAHRLSTDAVKAVSNFTLMWNMFEGVFCPDGANIHAFERVAERTIEHCRRTESNLDVKPLLRFWEFRYRRGSGFNERFDGLNFRRADRREHVEAVLRGEASEPAAELIALLIIIYRLRNNLFHGLKTIAMLNDQVENLNTASRALAYVMESSGHYLVDQPRTRRAVINRNEGEN